MIVFFAGSVNLYVVFREALHLDGAARLSERGYSNMMVKIYHLPYTANIYGATSNHLLFFFRNGGGNPSLCIKMMHTTTLLNYYKVSRVLITSHGSAKVAT
jgi:hypothetical protein